MRNEIFNHIKQNRNRYYSELKKTVKKASAGEKVNVPHPTIINLRAKQKDPLNFRKPILEKLPGFQLYTIPLMKTVNFIAIGSRRLFKKVLSNFEKINQKINLKTDSITQRFYEVSSKLFEDSYEYTQVSDELEINNSAGNFSYSSVLLTLDERYLSSQDRFILWINKMYGKVLLFLESDDWIVKNTTKVNPIEKKEIELKKVESNSKNPAMDIIDFFKDSNVRKDIYKTLRIGIRIFLKNPFTASFNLMCNVDIVILIAKKTFLFLFPVMNRFIQ